MCQDFVFGLLTDLKYELLNNFITTKKCRSNERHFLFYILFGTSIPNKAKAFLMVCPTLLDNCTRNTFLS